VFVVMVASECAPVAQAGGLGEVVFGLSGELERRGHAVDVIVPKYDCMRYDQIFNLTVAYHDLVVPWYGGAIPCTVWFGSVYGRRCYFIDPHSPDGYFNRGHLYGSDDDPMRFAFFSKAAMEFMLKTNRRPEVIHCHDWHTALIPVLLYEIYQYAGMPDQRVCFTIHNFAHQGITDEAVLRAAGLEPERVLTEDRLADPSGGSVNLTKGGIVYANFVTTVSPHYAWEARYSDQGMGLNHTLSLHQAKFGGVLNGIDYDVWNPEVDRFIPQRYGASTLENKYVDKEALRDRLLLEHTYEPLIAYVGRLDRQKGVELLQHALFFARARGAQFVVMGNCWDPGVDGDFWHLKHFLNDDPSCHLELGYDDDLAHLIYAGADMVLMPSLFEPCGLPQMIAARYGTVPIVRATGGLVDSVFDRDYSTRPPEDRNGYTFDGVDPPAVESALHRAIGLWYGYPTEFRRLMLNGISQDHSWAEPAQHYLDIYEYIRHK